MVLMPFSIPEHVPLLLSGAKKQTTRAPRKTPLKVGDILHCWYKPRQRNTCRNCIVQDCKTKFVLRDASGHQLSISTCSNHRNFFGIANVTDILHYTENNIGILPRGELQYHLFRHQGEKYMDNWARADGFSDLEEAHKWFTKSTKNDQWMFQPWDVIIFSPGWVK